LRRERPSDPELLIIVEKILYFLENRSLDM
jgi:hypothetical protein